MRIYVYWNLHKHLFSVRDTRTGRVVRHADYVIVRHAQFAVGPKGRARVLAEQRKNVHAGIRGDWVKTAQAGRPAVLRGYQRITYNPYRHTSFVRARDEAPIEGADTVILRIENGKARVYAKGLRLQKAVA